MPVTCRQIDGKFRLVSPSGSVESSAKHDTLESCQKQARAINANLDTGASFAVAYFAPELDEWKLSNEGGLVYEKEIIYEGNFVKSEEDLEFAVSRAVLVNWHQNINKMLSNGVEIPVPTKHTELDNPELNRGQVIASQLKTDTKGRYALFAKIKFANEEAAKLADSANVSLFSTPKFEDGKGNEYTNAIIHVALTNYPVIPDLDKFQAIAASFGELKMSSELLPIAQRMGIEGSDSMNDVGLSAAILTKFDELAAAVKGKEEGGEFPPKPEGDEPPPKPEDEEAKKKAEEEEKVKAAMLESPMAASFVKAQVESRTAKLDALVMGNNISKACRDDNVALWCTPEKCKLSLSHESENDTFDKTISSLRKNQILGLSEVEKERALVLANMQTSEKNPLVADAEARAKEGVS